jgi:hypothetical protein
MQQHAPSLHRKMLGNLLDSPSSSQKMSPGKLRSLYVAGVGAANRNSLTKSWSLMNAAIPSTALLAAQARQHERAGLRPGARCAATHYRPGPRSPQARYLPTSSPPPPTSPQCGSHDEASVVRVPIYAVVRKWHLWNGIGSDFKFPNPTNPSAEPL